jgi:RNA-directed DNA polymerase
MPPSAFYVDLRESQNSRELAVQLRISPPLLEELKSDDYKTRKFNTFEIPKRNSHRTGEFRIIWEIPEPIADHYKRFSSIIDGFLRLSCPEYPHQDVYGYTKKRGILYNAMPHSGKRNILHADIKNFFPSISDEAIRANLERIGCSKSTANDISQLLTIKKSLPLGFHTSPQISNFILLDLDKKNTRFVRARWSRIHEIR